jgi:hypothetical protein
MSLLLLNSQGTFWIREGFQSTHFCHLSLQPHGFSWALLIKLWTFSLGFMVFMAFNGLPWFLLKGENPMVLLRFIMAIPYFIGAQALIVSLSQGHLQETYMGPLLMFPLQIPLIFFMFSQESLPWEVWALVPWLFTVPCAYGLGKIIQSQSVL